MQLFIENCCRTSKFDSDYVEGKKINIVLFY